MRHTHGIEQDIARLDVTVEYASLVGVLDGACQRRQHPRGALKRQWFAPHILTECRSLDETHRKEIPTILRAHLID